MTLLIQFYIFIFEISLYYYSEKKLPITDFSDLNFVPFIYIFEIDYAGKRSGIIILFSFL